MLQNVITLVIGLLGGIAVGIQSPMAGAMSQTVGSVASSFILHASGAVFSMALLLVMGGEQIARWRSIPWPFLCAGVFGLVVILSISHTIPRIGATGAFLLIVVGQLVMGLLIDQFGWFGMAQRPLDLQRGVAILLLLGGAYLIGR